MPWLSAPVSSRLRLRRIAPDTHVDQASGGATGACRPGGFATPEELWYRNASNGLHKFAGCRRVGANLWLARIAGGPLLLHVGDGDTTSHSNSRSLSPVFPRGLPAAVESFTRSSESYQRVCAPSECGNTRARACAPGPCARESGSVVVRRRV